MSRFAKMILMASLVFGIFAFVAADDADAGGWGCYRGYSYSAPCYYRPSYDYCNYYAPSFYRTSNCGFYPSYRTCYPSYSSCYSGGWGYGGYGGYCVPTSYGQFNW
jgi:hypothetical protein